MNVPAAWGERQNCQVAATAGAAQVDSPVLVANPELTDFDYVKIGQYVYEDRAEFHGWSFLRVVFRHVRSSSAGRLYQPRPSHLPLGDRGADSVDQREVTVV